MADLFEPSTTQCRASAGVCDAAETCTGSDAACPADGMEPAGSICRSAAGLCDRVETCNGVAPSCPADGYISIGVVCRFAQDVCDVLDFCRGDGPLCVDRVRFSAFQCRPAADACDLAEHCTGTDIACPADLLVDCDDGVACTPDSCDAILGCVNESAAICDYPVPATPKWGLALIALLSAGVVLLAQRSSRAGS